MPRIPPGSGILKDAGADPKRTMMRAGTGTTMPGLRTLFLLLAAMLAATSAHALSVLNRGNGSEIKSLDPHFISTVAESTVIGDLLMGLTTLDAAARPIPGAAASWEVSADAKTWTFHLRNHLWSDGVPVTAQDFVFA